MVGRASVIRNHHVELDPISVVVAVLQIKEILSIVVKMYPEDVVIKFAGRLRVLEQTAIQVTGQT